MANREQATVSTKGLARDSAIPPVTIKVSIPKSTQPPAQPSTSKASQ
jgi:hypothetical protein